MSRRVRLASRALRLFGMLLLGALLQPAVLHAAQAGATCVERKFWSAALPPPDGPPDPVTLARSTSSLAADAHGLWLAISARADSKKNRSEPRIEILRFDGDPDDWASVSTRPPVHVLEGDAPRLARLQDGGLLVVGRDARKKSFVAWRGSGDGTRWKRPKKISKQRKSAPAAYGSLVVTPAGTLVFPAAYLQSGGFEIICLRSTDGGKSWDESAPVAARGATDPEIAAQGNTLVMVLRVRGRLACSRSTDDGRTWASPWDIGQSSDEVPHALVPEGNGLSLLWTEPVSDTTLARPWLRAVSRATTNDAGATWRRQPQFLLRPGPKPVVRTGVTLPAGLAVLLEERRGMRRAVECTLVDPGWVAGAWQAEIATASHTPGLQVQPPIAAHQALRVLGAFTLDRPVPSKRLFVEGYFMRGLAAASNALGETAPGCEAGFDVEAARAAALAWGDSLLARQYRDGTWHIGYASSYYADMAAAAALYAALEPRADPGRLKRYETSVTRYFAALEADGMQFPNGAIGIGHLIDPNAMPPRVTRREPYLVATALAGVELRAWMYKRTRQPEHRSRALAALEYTLSQIGPNGFLEKAAREEGETRVSAYVEEGWMAADLYLDDPAVLRRLRKALPAHVQWLLRTQGADGSWRGQSIGEYARTPAIVNFLLWYDRRCEPREDVKRAIRRASIGLIDPERWKSDGMFRTDEEHEILRALAMRPIAALVAGRPMP